MTKHKKNYQIDSYKQRILKMIAAGQIKMEPGKVDHIHVKHDPWCGVFKGGRCDCGPEIDITTEYQRGDHEKAG